METGSIAQLQAVTAQPVNKRPPLREHWFANLDLTGADLRGIDFSAAHFQNVVLDQANLEGAILHNTYLNDCSLADADLRDADLRTASLRRANLSHSDISGANLYGAVLERADLTGIVSSPATKWFRLHCPATGPFVAFKKCFNDRIVQLLVPADALRTSATRPSCRCNKAKVLKITNFAQTEEYDEAWSLVDENFVYRKGHWVTVANFNADRWYDSTTGIHFWLTREEAMAY